MKIDEARKRIKKTKNENRKELNFNSLRLTSNELHELFLEFKEFDNLTTLDLSHNNLTNVDFLKELIGGEHLLWLDLSNNNLTNVDSLKELIGLNTLNLSNNNLTNADSLEELRFLWELNLSNNNLTNVDYYTNF